MICERTLPAPPVHTNQNTMESVPGGTTDHLKRCLLDPTAPDCEGVCAIYPDHPNCVERPARDTESQCGL
jgi:hypothetical protein